MVADNVDREVETPSIPRGRFYYIVKSTYTIYINTQVAYILDKSKKKLTDH